MNSSRRSEVSFLIVGLLMGGCASSSYKIGNRDEGRTELLVTSDRVTLECEHITDYTGDIKNAYGFMMRVLDENNTVLTVNQGNILGKEDCVRRMNKIEKILKNGKTIFIGGMGNLDKPRIGQGRLHLFPGLGRFPDNGRVLQFMVIWNERGLCYNAYSGDRKPCPSDEFPIVK